MGLAKVYPYTEFEVSSFTRSNPKIRHRLGEQCGRSYQANNDVDTFLNGWVREGVCPNSRVDLRRFVFFSRDSILLLTRDIDYSNSVRPSVCPSVRLSVRNTLVLYENGLTYRHSFFTIR